jgi:uncharacterized protein with NRDE domain
MCTLVVALRSNRRWPVIVAANRDERLGRPAEDWAIREPAAGPRHASPRDLVGGGTWIGVSARGLFAAVTNFHAGAGFPDPERHSRGELVVRVLAHADAAGARAELEQGPAERYNPFHLVVADAVGAFLWRYDGSSAAFAELGPGLHVVTESDPEGRSARGERVRARWPLDPDPLLLREVLVQHAPSSPDGTCIHLDPHYGTRSATILRLAPALAASDLFVTTGHPCTAPLEERSGLLAELARSP